MNRARPPVWTIAICTIALVAYALPELQAFLVYDREAIRRGELWRLISGHLVHFSMAHLVKDGLGFFLVGTALEAQGARRFALLMATVACFIALALYALEPGMVIYGGLSGLVIAAFAYLCLQGATEAGRFGWACRMSLVLLVAKIILDFVSPMQTLDGFVLAAMSHAAGAIAATVLFMLTQRAPVASLLARGGA